ncbi:MAG: thymidine phosphorylase, partial [Firmicutes bacterium]|nr:thymidine phosphorylase [Bacillota bacterium]
MNVVDIINKKRQGQVLSADELEYMVMGFTNGVIPDYQMSALLMAICLKGVTKEETVELTRIMRDSGDTVDLSGIKGIKVDKHSTGGVGDKTTLIVAPIAAACGVPIAKMSGRGLGFTGGTVDKMESIPGFKTTMEQQDFMNAVNRAGIAVIGQTGQIAPADKKIYALRDVTATTENIGLITSSIMSKKLAAGSDAIVLDVKCGGGAFMKTQEDATELARWMVDIGKSSGKKMMAFITDMNQPLGNAVGNALEVQEAMDVLKGEGPEDITELAIKLAGGMIYLGEQAQSIEEGMKLA